MSIKMLCMGAMALSMVTGTALAGATTGTSALDDPQKMSPFFTDTGMKTMKSEAEFKTAWAAMPTDDRTMIMKECSDAGIAQTHADFCKMAKQLGGNQ
ncbi:MULTISPECIES: hypothetical protein [unclassified Mesorhizobium]|uniref:hypothetical protein n=1 Tax=unclassified Mesorhizobium TaxID=325217 RepID=UPI000FD7C85C|nr:MULTISPECIES: hypothetical protein [unclassified Mesorhizobium]TGQ34678.1 hypothetical protein EN859_024890 [Mesorhizobium sp. M00.F.Ca.ET.216.01.1.1]TIS57590.1 MAG: hypothetical protein E5W91_13600 [Mesorhizobium sp.]TIS88633.1 MAG: hypothetical protein E5W89_19935 [Mesorhizobium sp.]TJW07274.1 MAG: hypothetical protein E5W82_23980 [Mesorhizobium sp.]TJW34931.1 MAG: hypothetical protein E5W83_35255 [Mesorhizobium sp.]